MAIIGNIPYFQTNPYLSHLFSPWPHGGLKCLTMPRPKIKKLWCCNFTVQSVQVLCIHDPTTNWLCLRKPIIFPIEKLPLLGYGLKPISKLISRQAVPISVLIPKPWTSRCDSSVFFDFLQSPVTLWETYKTLWKITMFNGKIHYKWSFSIAMLVITRGSIHPPGPPHLHIHGADWVPPGSPNGPPQPSVGQQMAHRFNGSF